MGYFDRVVFDHVNYWLDFSPRKSSEGQGNTPSKTENPLSIYPIKLMFPTNATISYLEGFNLDYQSWMNDLSQLFDANPCITIALLNLTDQFKESFNNDICGEQLRQLADVICSGHYYQEMSHSQRQNFIEAGGSNAHVCLLPSLGYSDYCLLIAEKNWAFAPALLEYLHRARRARKIVLSTDYAMPVYHILPNHLRVQQNPAFDNTKISIHIHLKPGISMGQLAQSIKEVADIWQVSGSSDCVLVSKKGKRPEDLFCSLSLGIDKNTQNAFQNFVIRTESKLQRKATALPQNRGKVLLSEENPNISNLRYALLEYRKLLSEDNRHMRLFNATWERVTLVESICSQAHNGELRKIMNRWLDVFTYCLKREIKDLQDWKQGLALMNKEEKEAYWPQVEDCWTDVEDALNIFVTQVGSFLADLSRSDSFSMESERYNHASVGSATKLLLAYNQWQNQFVLDMQKESNNTSEYVFLVRSGGCDSTNTDSIFSNLDAQLITINDKQSMFERKPLITHMSEMALFDCSGAIFRMTHECMHYCGERNRKERVQALITFISRYYSRALTKTLFGRDEYYNKLCKNLKDLFGLEIQELNVKLEECWKSAFISLLKKISIYISTQLNNQYIKARTSWDERNYIGDELYVWLKTVLTEMFFCYEVDSQNFVASNIVVLLYKSILETASDYYKNCDEVIRQYNTSLIFCSIERRSTERTIAEYQESGNYTDTFLWSQIIFTLTWLISDPSLPINSNDSFTSLGNHTVSEVLDFVIECFSESFADMAACVRLDAALSDYLLAFVFETWDLNKAFPLGETHVYRIAIVLHLCYPQALQVENERTILSETAKQELKDAIQRLVMNGMPQKRINFELLCDRIEKILNLYQGLSLWITEPLKDYLSLCKKQHNRNAKMHTYIHKYPDAFHKIHLLDAFNHSSSDTDYADQVVQMLTSLITIGKKDGDIKCRKN